MNYSGMCIDNFIKHIVKYNNVNDIINSIEDLSIKGFVYERLWDIIIKFGFYDLFPNHRYEHIIGNINTGFVKKLTTYENYLQENVISGNSSGVSDITLLEKSTNTYIFFTSKLYKNITEKSVNDFDISNMIAVIEHNKQIYQKYKIIILCNDKKELMKKISNSNSSSEYITKYMTQDNILDVNDLNTYFLKFKYDIINKKNYDYYLSEKENLEGRFHQELISNKTYKLSLQKHKEFLWACKCRSGKTYMTGDLILKLSINKINVLIITPAPTETIPQFTDDLFYKFKNFEPFKIHHINDIKKLNKINSNDNNIIILSKHFIQ